LGERLLCKQEVVGSIPSGSTIGYAHGVAKRIVSFVCPRGFAAAGRLAGSTSPTRCKRSARKPIRTDRANAAGYVFS
jgi:hypothetical protein